MRYFKNVYALRLRLPLTFTVFVFSLFIWSAHGYSKRNLEIQYEYDGDSLDSTEESLIQDEMSIYMTEPSTENRMSSLDEYLKYIVNDMLFPIDGIVKGYCLYRSALDEMKNGFDSVSKEEITVLSLILSGSWKNPISFISRCKNGFKNLSNISKITSKSNEDLSWSSISKRRRVAKASRINLCFRARICSRLLKKREGTEQIREFLNSRTQYSLIYPNNGSEETVWNVIREYKHIISSGVIKGEIDNYLRVIILFNYINKAIKHIQGTPLDFPTCIALINAMVREKSLNEWLAASRGKKKNNHELGFDKVTNLRYNHDLSTADNIVNFKVRTCTHVILSSEVLFDEYSDNVQSKYVVLSALKGRITWICRKMFSK
ncbi:hypothetical protein FG386_003131 [Cryptosporidium ryanae]|uniref:uncharacterized protein n=1 Tax=Cryptosporidium ryanae TaxID=515981 RepID=UPI00351A91DE|nr:hypothetical protein FG386_003131 [Cryptosporidium ryanae]